MREDIVLLLLSTTLKNLANELEIFVWSGTQVNANEPDADFADESVIRGSRAIPDKADYGSVLRFASPDKLKLIQPLLKTGLPRPNMFIDIYKNRRSQFKRARLWIYADLGICRFEDLFLTDEWGEQLPVSILRAAYPEGIPSIMAIMSANEQVVNEIQVSSPPSKISTATNTPNGKINITV